MSSMIPSESHDESCDRSRDILGVKGHMISHVGSHGHVTT